jgi:multidrug efflux pump
MILALTSDALDQGQMYDAASTILAQKISQVSGIGQVTVGGSSLPAVRVELDPKSLNRYGIALEDVRATLSAANANRPKGVVEDGSRQWQVGANDQSKKARDYLPLIVAWRDGAAVRLNDVAEVVDSVQDLRNAGSANGKPSVSVVIFRQAGGNIIESVDAVKAMLPELRASIPSAIDLEVVMDRTTTIRASLKEIERALAISVGLVILVVFLFLRSARATLIPSIAVPVSLIGTLGVMYLCGYSLDNLSLMALAIATGFVVDDAIVVLENISRHIENGMEPKAAAILGAKEVGFTVLSISLSLVAVFIPILLMGGVLGRLFREFAVTLSVAILVSLVVSLTTTPMMCAYLLKRRPARRPGPLARASEGAFAALQRVYARSLAWSLAHPKTILLGLLATVAVNVLLYAVIPKGFFPQQDTGRLMGSIQADQSISFQALRQKQADFVEIVRNDPGVATVIASIGGGRGGSGNMFVTLKPVRERNATADEVIARLRPKLAAVAGASLFLQATQDVRIGGRTSGAQYQYTLSADDLEELRAWTPRLQQALMQEPLLADVNTDQQVRGLQISLEIDRATAARLGVSARAVDQALYDAFGQAQVSTIYTALNQYRVVMEVAPRWWQSPEALENVYVRADSGKLVALSAFSRFSPSLTPLSVNHQGLFAATTVSFNLAPGASLSDATRILAATTASLGMPATVHGSLQGTARAFQSSLDSQPWLILTAILAVYIVLGMLYESLVHPITILSTLPSAGVGALLALRFCKTELSVIAVIGVILLIGIVKKNAIMMIDFALDAQRTRGAGAREAIYEACLLRLRPILMTTVAALLGAVPLAIGAGDGAELRQPLGISIVGGLVMSQALTLYTTPVLYLTLERLRAGFAATWRRARGSGGAERVAEARA